MGLQYRAIRAAASAVLVVAAVGTGGMAGMTSALGADPSDVMLTGTVATADDARIAGVHLRIVQTDPEDGAQAAVLVVTTLDGSFSAALNPWGTAAKPSRLTIDAHEELAVDVGNCSQTSQVDVSVYEDVALADGPPAPLDLRGTRSLVGEVCGTTATPPAPDSNQGAGGGRPGATPPPTDRSTAELAASGAADRHGPALSIGFVVGLLIAGVWLLRRPGASRRD